MPIDTITYNIYSNIHIHKYIHRYIIYYRVFSKAAPDLVSIFKWQATDLANRIAASTKSKAGGFGQRKA